MIIYVKNHSIHVTKIQERNFFEIKKSNVKNHTGFGWGNQSNQLKSIKINYKSIKAIKSNYNQLKSIKNQLENNQLYRGGH